MTTCMSQGRSLYRLYDADPTTHGCIGVGDFNEALTYSKLKWGIFWTVNQFDGPRKKENVKKIISWAVDIDEGSKDEQLSRIHSFIKPSAIIETKKGYHCYYDSIDGSVKNYEKVVAGLIHHLHGDKKAADVARILRVPGFCHWKDQNNPFAIKWKYFSDIKYTEKEMLKIFPLPKSDKEDQKEKIYLKKVLKFQDDTKLFERVWSIDCEQALKNLSGTEAVGFDKFEFRDNKNGNLNVISNGKSTSCFIDSNKRIGSSDSAGLLVDEKPPLPDTDSLVDLLADPLRYLL